MHPNAEVVLRGFQAFAEGDMATMKELFHDDAVWHTGGRNRFTGDYQGVDAILRLFGDFAEAAEISNDLHAALADDEHVVTLVNSTARKNGETLESPTVFIFHVDEGKVTEVWTSVIDQYAVDAFWG